MIIQSLHKKENIQSTEKRKKIFLLSFFFLCFSVLNAQDSIPIKPSVSEEKNTQFQEFFFKALSEKAKNDPQKAIEALDECNLLLPNNKAVLFELSKNYFKLNRNFEALEYVKKALLQEPNNLWLLEHLVDIHKRTRSFTDAIETQQQIATLHPKKKRALVYLYLQNKDVPKAKQILAELEDAKLLNNRLRSIRDKLNDTSKDSLDKKNTLPENNTTNTDLKTQFSKDRSFTVLHKLLLELYQNNAEELLAFSEEGLTLFPAQPLVYLMNGRALLNNHQYKKAITSLQNGIDFVIDNPRMESDFYKELIKAYEKLGDKKNVSKFQKKLNAL